MVALVGDADEGFDSAGEVDHLGGAREQGSYPHGPLYRLGLRRSRRRAA
jgi:hypothetical protein